MDKVVHLPSVQAGLRFVRRCYKVTTEDGREVLFITADAGKGEQAFPLTTYVSDQGLGIHLGSIVTRSLTISILQKGPSVKTMGDLYNRLSVEMAELVPSLQKIGIRRIEVIGSQTVAVEEAPQALQRLADLNRDKALPVFRPS